MRTEPEAEGPDPVTLPVAGRVVVADADRVVLELAITPDLFQPWGIVHGGVHCALGEQAASLGGRIWLGDRGTVRATAVSTRFLRAVRAGVLRAEAIPVHRGRSQQLWQVRVTVDDDDARPVAVGDVRLTNRP